VWFHEKTGWPNATTTVKEIMPDVDKIIDETVDKFLERIIG
jgi:hypothetical protein